MQAANLKSTQTEGDFEFTLHSKHTFHHKSMAVALHLNGRSDGPTLIVTGKTEKTGRTTSLVKFRIPEIVRAVRSIQNEKNPVTVSLMPTLSLPEFPLGPLALEETFVQTSWEKPLISIGSAGPCNKHPKEVCTPIQLSLADNSELKNSHFSLVPFLSKSEISVPQGPIQLVSTGFGFSSYEFEVLSQSSKAESQNPMGIIAATLQKTNGEIVDGWPLIAIRDGKVEPMKNKKRTNKNESNWQETLSAK